jgi:hypothetical protein
MFYFIFSYLFYAYKSLLKAMENSTSSDDLASYEGKYPKDMFNKTVIANGQAIGRVAKETGDLIVVFGDSNDSRFDIPKSKVAVAGGSVIIDEPVAQYAVDRDAPLPEGKSLRPSAEEIRQKAGEVEVIEEPSLPAASEPSAIEQKAKEVAGEVKGVGYELKHAGTSVEEKVRDAGEAISDIDVEEAARKAASEVKEAAHSSARAVEEKMSVAQSNVEASLSADSALKFEKESKRTTTEVDLGSYEGRYPGELFNKDVVLNNQPIGHVAKETEDTVVVFSDTDSSIRFDIPRSAVVVEGGSIVVNEDLLFRYRMRSDAPLPVERLRPSAEEIRKKAAEQVVEVEKQQQQPPTTPDRIMSEGQQLSTAPRPTTMGVSVPEGYVDTESEIVKKMKSAANELKEVIVAGTKVAKKKVKKVQREAAEKQAAMDAEAISRMGGLAMEFADSFEDVLSEIRTRTYAEQVQIYTGFLKLMDQQRDLVLARRDLAARLRDSVSVPVVKPEDVEGRRLHASPELPAPEKEEEQEETTTTAKRTDTTVKKRSKRSGAAAKRSTRSTAA